MDENSCEGKTTENGNKPVEERNSNNNRETITDTVLNDKKDPVGGKFDRINNLNLSESGRSESSIDISGPSFYFPNAFEGSKPLESQSDKQLPSSSNVLAMEIQKAQSFKDLPICFSEFKPKTQNDRGFLNGGTFINFESSRFTPRDEKETPGGSNKPVFALGKPQVNETTLREPLLLKKNIQENSIVTSPPPPPPPPPPRAPIRLADNIDQPQSRRNSIIGPPPSYSFVMKQKRKIQKMVNPELVTDRPPPPPMYAGETRELYPPRENDDLNRVCLLPSFAEPIWRSHSQPAYCPRCGILVLTTTHSHESVATHVAALALCLFGCWPCCILPYCMNVCKNTYHHCPVCQLFLGSYTPW